VVHLSSPSKVVQLAIRHLTSFLPYQVKDTKDFLLKVESINKRYAPLPENAVFAVCDVISLYPNVNNDMGIPAISELLREHPSSATSSTDCILEALSIALNNNFCTYTDGANETVFAKPNRGTAMGPSHACDYVDCFMGALDRLVVDSSPVPMLSSLRTGVEERDRTLDWSRFRDDAITILPSSDHVDDFVAHLQNLHPPSIKWTVKWGRTADYLDLKLAIKDGTIVSDVFSKHSHSYLPPYSCHSPGVFKGLIKGIGTRLRLLCSEDSVLEIRLLEYARYLSLSGWTWEKALSELRAGAHRDRNAILNKPRRKKKKKLAWVTCYDPRAPSKTQIISKNIHLLHASTSNAEMFPRNLLIAADRRRMNIGAIYKPTVPRRFIKHGPYEKPGFWPCSKKCDTCAHSEEICNFQSKWDGRRWYIRKHLTCSTPNVVYVIKCTLHPDSVYVGSTKNLKTRWANHKSDCKLNKVQKSSVANHVHCVSHPPDPNFAFLKIFAIDCVHAEHRLLEKEIWWQCNLGSIFVGLNIRKDFNTMILTKNRTVF